MRLKTIHLAKDQRVVNDAYRKGWDRIFGKKGEIDEKVQREDSERDV